VTSIVCQPNLRVLLVVGLAQILKLLLDPVEVVERGTHTGDLRLLDIGPCEQVGGLGLRGSYSGFLGDPPKPSPGAFLDRLSGYRLRTNRRLCAPCTKDEDVVASRISFQKEA
jgi:hypothetical protein